MSTIAPNNTGIIYSPYNWEITGTSATTIQPGAYFKALVTGNPADLTATFDLTGVLGDPPELLVSVDELPPVRVPVAASIPLDMDSAQNTWGKHTVEIMVAGVSNVVDRWNGGTAVRFTGFTSAATIGLGATRPKPHRALVIGDSINEGFRALRSGSTGTNPSRNDARLGWGYPLGDLLGVEAGLIAQTGVGINKGGDGGIPKFPDAWKQLRNGVLRDFSVEPDVIIINAGQNDLGRDDVATQSEAVRWFNDILATFPTAPMYVIRPWSGAVETQLQAAVQAVTDPARITYVDTTGWWSSTDSPDTIHPYGYINVADLSPRLASVIDLSGNQQPQEPEQPQASGWIKTDSGKVPIGSLSVAA